MIIKAKRDKREREKLMKKGFYLLFISDIYLLYKLIALLLANKLFISILEKVNKIKEKKSKELRVRSYNIISIFNNYKSEVE